MTEGLRVQWPRRRRRRRRQAGDGLDGLLAADPQLPPPSGHFSRPRRASFFFSCLVWRREWAVAPQPKVRYKGRTRCKCQHLPTISGLDSAEPTSVARSSRRPAPARVGNVGEEVPRAHGRPCHALPTPSACHASSRAGPTAGCIICRHTGSPGGWVVSGWHWLAGDGRRARRGRGGFHRALNPACCCDGCCCSCLGASSQLARRWHDAGTLGSTLVGWAVRAAQRERRAELGRLGLGAWGEGELREKGRPCV